LISSCSLIRIGTMVAPGASPWNGTLPTGAAAMMLATLVPWPMQSCCRRGCL